jgi:hypothetical protein
MHFNNFQTNGSIRRVIPVLLQSDSQKFIDKLVNNPTAKYAVIRLAVKLNYQNQRLPADRRFVICKESFAMSPMVIFAQKSSVVLDYINRKIEVFKTAGLIDLWLKRFINKNSKNIDNIHMNPLNFDHVKACFLVLAVGNVLSFAAFLVENLMKLRRSRNC